MSLFPPTGREKACKSRPGIPSQSNEVVAHISSTHIPSSRTTWSHPARGPHIALHSMPQSTASLSSHPAGYSSHTPSLPPLPFSLPHSHTQPCRLPFQPEEPTGFAGHAGPLRDSWRTWSFTHPHPSSLPAEESGKSSLECVVLPLHCFTSKTFL